MSALVKKVVQEGAIESTHDFTGAFFKLTQRYLPAGSHERSNALYKIVRQHFWEGDGPNVYVDSVSEHGFAVDDQPGLVVIGMKTFVKMLESGAVEQVDPDDGAVMWERLKRSRS